MKHVVLSAALVLWCFHGNRFVGGQVASRVSIRFRQLCTCVIVVIQAITQVVSVASATAFSSFTPFSVAARLHTMLAANSRAAMAHTASDLRVKSAVPVCQAVTAVFGSQASLIQLAQPKRCVVCNAASAPEKPSSQKPKMARGAAADPTELKPLPSTANGKLISKTEVASFIQRDDLMDQMYRWSIIEAGEAGVRNFGLPMNVEPFYRELGGQYLLWGFKVSIFKEGTELCDIGIMFDTTSVSKHEWVGRGDDGFPVLEGKASVVEGQFFEIWKLCTRPVDEPLRASIRAYCTGLVTALNRYYAFGSVFVDDAQ